MLLRDAKQSDLDLFVPHADDFSEALATGIHWRDNLKDAIAAGCKVLEVDGIVVAFGGNLGDQCWFVTDRAIQWLDHQERQAFRKAIREYRDFLLWIYPKLWNYVWVGNKNHIRFLKTIGAVFHDEYTTSPATGEKFQLFTIGG